MQLIVLHCPFFFQAEDGIRGGHVTGVQTCALPIWRRRFFLLLVGMTFCCVSYPFFVPLLARCPTLPGQRSEERRVGKEGGSGWSTERYTRQEGGAPAGRELEAGGALGVAEHRAVRQ